MSNTRRSEWRGVFKSDRNKRDGVTKAIVGCMTKHEGGKMGAEDSNAKRAINKARRAKVRQELKNAS